MRAAILQSVISFCGALWVAGCASAPDSPSSILEPVTENEASAPSTEAVAPHPSERLREQLSALGYQGLGMELEDPATLALLEKVFSAPEAQGLDLKLVYTGIRMQFDASQKSLTNGGTKDVAVILAFLRKSVPKRPVTPDKTTPTLPKSDSKKPASIRP